MYTDTHAHKNTNTETQTHTHTQKKIHIEANTNTHYDGTAINAPVFMKQLEVNGVFKKRIESSKKKDFCSHTLQRKKIAHLNDICSTVK